MKDLAIGAQGGVPLLHGSGSDYLNWNFRVRLFLEAKGVSEVLTGEAPEVAAERAKFEDKDRIAKALLVSCLSDDVLEIVREKMTTREMWASLEVCE